MLENRTRLLLILSQDMLDQARLIADRATTALKLPVSLPRSSVGRLSGWAEAQKLLGACCQHREPGQGCSPEAARSASRR